MAHEPVFTKSAGSFCKVFVLKLILKSVVHVKFLPCILMVDKAISNPLFSISPAFSHLVSKPTDKGCDTCSNKFFVWFLYTSTDKAMRLKKLTSTPIFV